MSLSSVVETEVNESSRRPKTIPATSEPVVLRNPATRTHALAGWLPTESRFNRVTMCFVAIAVAVAFAGLLFTYWVPTHGGVDQNGYLVGGRQIMHTGTMKIAPVDPATGRFDPHQMVGKMWVGVDYGLPTERFYPKYPIGLPLIVASLLKIGGPAYGTLMVYALNPVAMTLAVFGTFLLLRPFCGSYLAVLGELVFATSPTTAMLGIDDNSHATAVCCVVWGMTGLFAWWRMASRANESSDASGFSFREEAAESSDVEPIAATSLADSSIIVDSSAESGSLPSQHARLGSRQLESVSRLHTVRTAASILLAPTAGFLLGYAALIRYSEATLLAPILLAILFKLARRWPSGRDVGTALLLLIGWAIPFAVLVKYNLAAMHTLTGYDPTNESKPGTSFTFEHFVDNWETCLRQIGTYGLYFIFPVGLIGLVWLWSAHRRAAMVISAWIVPCLACYTLYYWAPDGTNTGYLRFFLTIFPGLVLCAMWLLSHVQRLIVASTPSTLGRWIAVSVPTLAVIAACSVHAENAAREMEAGQFRWLDLKTTVDQLANVFKDHPAAIFSNDANYMMNLQFVQDNLLFDLDTYNPDYVHNLMNNRDPGDAQTLDPGRSKSLQDRLGDVDRAGMEKQMRRTIAACIEQGHRVFFIERGNDRRRRNDESPRRLPDWINRLTAPPPPDGGPTLFADVVYRWRLTMVPPIVSEVHDDKPTFQARAKKATVQPIDYQQPWLVFEVSTHALPTSPEKQAVLDFDQARESARVAEVKKRDEDKARSTAERQKREADVQAKFAAKTEQIQQLTTARDAAAKQAADTHTKLTETAQAVAESAKTIQADRQSIAALQKDRDATKQSLATLQKDRDATQQSLAASQKEHDAAQQRIDAMTREQAALNDQLVTLRRQLVDARSAATQPSATQPSR